MGTANAEQPAGASSDKLRHVESISQLPSGAGKISGINALVLGESLAAEEHDLIFPSPEFSTKALVSSPQQYREMYERSIRDPAGFWSEIAETFYWKEKWNASEICSENLDVTKGPVQISLSVVQWLLTKFSSPWKRSGYSGFESHRDYWSWTMVQGREN